MAIPAIIQPALLKDIIRVSPDFFGYTNAFLQNMGQIAILAMGGIIGVLSDRVERNILCYRSVITRTFPENELKNISG